MKPVTKTYVDTSDLTEEQKNLLEWKKKGFDLRTRIVDPKTGRMIRHQPYSLICSRDLGEDYFIRDGKRYNRNGIELTGAPGSTQPTQIKK